MGGWRSCGQSTVGTWGPDPVTLSEKGQVMSTEEVTDGSSEDSISEEMTESRVRPGSHWIPGVLRARREFTTSGESERGLHRIQLKTPGVSGTVWGRIYAGRLGR